MKPCEKALELFERKKYNEAYLLLLKASHEGDAESQRLLGDFYDKGITVPKDKNEAIKWYSKAAKQKNPEACLNMALAYKNGKHKPQNYSKCVQYLNDCQELPQAKYHLGICYLNGLGVEQDAEAALSLISMAASSKSNDAALMLGNLYMKRNQPEKAFEYTLQAAQQGNMVAYVNLAYCYAEGIGIESNTTNALFWYGKAAQEGDIDAMYSIGQLVSDRLQKIEWLMMAAKEGHIDACVDLAHLLYHTKPFEAFVWFRTAAHEDDPHAQYMTGKCCQIGHGTPREQHQAFRWFVKAADHEHIEATYESGYCYLKGNGVRKNVDQGLLYLRKAHDMGSMDACYELSRHYYYEVDDTQTAYELAIIAAKQNHAYSQYFAGFLAEYSDHYDAAIFWYTKAASQGNVKAQYALPGVQKTKEMIDNR